MLVYPIAYTCLTLPLAAVRMAAQSGKRLSTNSLLFGGACIASCGWVDVLLYVVTRRTILSLQPSSSASRKANGMNGMNGMNGLNYGNITTIGGTRSSDGSSDNDSQVEFVKMERVVEVTVENATREELEAAKEAAKPMGTVPGGTGFW